MNKLFATTLITLASLGITLSASAQEATLFDTDVVSTQSRAQVHAGVIAALAAGQDLRYGEATRWTPSVASSKTRAQVHAETMAAIRLGLVSRGEANTPSATPAQAEQIRLAGQQALSLPVAQAQR